MNVRYLPELSAEGMAAQVTTALARGLTASVEFTLDADPRDLYWRLWKLPMFGVRDVGAVLAEVRACVLANPGALVRLVGYDPVRQVRAVSILVGRAGGAQVERPAGGAQVERRAGGALVERSQ